MEVSGEVGKYEDEDGLLWVNALGGVY
jgi:hypothetical protein